MLQKSAAKTDIPAAASTTAATTTTTTRNNATTAAAAASAPDDGDFREQKKRMRLNYSESDRSDSVKKQGPITKGEKAVVAVDVATRKYSAPLGSVVVDEGSITGKGTEKAASHYFDDYS
jgi:hypothetical protein